MSLALWDPFRSTGSFDRAINDVFGQNATRFIDTARRWQPAADLVSDEDGYTVRFDVPGVSKDAIDINVDDRVLTLSGERTDTIENDDKKNVYRRETFYGKFSRAFRLPEDADVENVKATYVDGVLEVRVPKSAQAQPRRIEIGAAQ
jgi:HSP20 family protein